MTNFRFIDRHLGYCALIAAALAVSCGRFIPGMGANNQAELIFSNESIDEADVYAVVAAGDPIRIGSVVAGRTDTLPLSSTVTGGGGGVNIVARVLASSRAPQTGRLSIHTGDRYEVRLPPDETTLIVLPGR